MAASKAYPWQCSNISHWLHVTMNCMQLYLAGPSRLLPKLPVHSACNAVHGRWLTSAPARSPCT
jgi:hypothetical protein